MTTVLIVIGQKRPRGRGVCRTNALESLVIAGFVRGLSVRDVEATLADAASDG